MSATKAEVFDDPDELDLIETSARLRLTDIRLSDIREHLGLTPAKPAERERPASWAREPRSRGQTLRPRSPSATSAEANNADARMSSCRTWDDGSDEHREFRS
ncbi:hypothetical protein [Actinomadura oligospora]|uniref:hypothetical protein n=1 Tax=Actinomadura oligospora TaxID=111804 RepID=UPI001476249D|nr:hypothetical protein [Actinomadura oligospora]